MNIRWMPGFFRVASLLMVLVAVALLAAIITMHFAIHGAEVQVPALKSMTIADARRETAGLGLNFDVDNRYYSGDVAPGHILTQSPSAGTIVRRGWTVRVSESLGPQKVDVPNVVGDSQHLAELQVQRAGLEVGAVAQLPDAGSEDGTVIAQDPPPHAQDIEKPAVDLLVSTPTNQTADALAQVGMKAAPPDFINVAIPPIGGANSQPTQPVKPNSVVAQQPEAGIRVDQNTTVRLAVAK
jgi:eukaryotic-like serine/threonine-protein kinase